MWNLLKYQYLSRYFSEVKGLSVKYVGRKIGGKVEVNTEGNIFKNACALRMSYALIHAGITISRGDGAVSSGKDGKWYLYRVEDLVKLIKNNIKSSPLNSTIDKYKNDFKGKKGIIVFSSCGWADATGHIDLFDGAIVEGQEYSMCADVQLYEIP